MHAPTIAQPTTDRGFRVATLRALVERGKRAHPDLASRLDKAAGLLVTRAVERGESGRVWFVQSERHPDQEYIVTPRRGVWRCTCQDFVRRSDWCKHGLAVALLRRCQETEDWEPDPPPAPARHPAEPREHAAPIPYQPPLAIAYQSCPRRPVA